ncbi:rhodanese family chromate resistance protein ChrE [Cupriavidus sp. BIC8F]|uniref:rhodanese family chromate resistance protein ChrE n=1 Tax=Cupriavidus sp. BIC8F TaxID=3079014 RepID=UPI002916CF1F|nr:rhodanese family chromate resistance protein ChrE [Cupriavidus sp. BIC8F]
MPTAISPRELAEAIQALVPPQIIDVRRKPAFDASVQMIAGASWRDPDDIASWISTLDTSRPVIVYCVRGHQVSQGCAARLETAGLRAAYLAGGIEQWADDNHPTIGKA